MKGGWNKAKGMSGYVSDETCQEVEALIYNDLSLDSIFEHVLSDGTVKEFNEEFIKQILLPGEKYIQVIPGDVFAYTSYARLINTHTKRLIRPTITEANILVYNRKDRYNAKEIFDQQGWEFDLDKLTQRYIDNDWKCSKARYLRERDRNNDA